jgi:hypothetical protein
MSDDLRITITNLAEDGSTYRDRMVLNFNARCWSEHLAGATVPQAYINVGDINGKTPQERWEAEEATAMDIIASSVPDHVFNRIKRKTNTHEFWNAVKAIYQTRSTMIAVDLKLLSAKLEDDNDARAHFTTLQDLREQLASMVKNYDNDEFAAILLCSLPPSYKTTIHTIHAGADCNNTPITPDQVIRVVTNEYNRHVIRQSKNKNGSGESFATNSRKRGKRNVECYNCHKLGHYKSDCWAKGGDKEGQRPPRRNDNGSNNHNCNNRGRRNNRTENRNKCGRNNNRNNDKRND